MPESAAAPPAAIEDGSGGRTARGVVAVVMLAVAVPLLYLLGTPHGFYDLKIYMKAMDWWAAGHPLYDYAQPDQLQGWLYFTYPPLAALLLRPFAAINLGVAIVIFTILTSAAILLTTWWLVTPIADRRRLPRWMTLGIAVPLIFVVESVRETLTFGQINMLLVVLVLADLLVGVPRKARWTGAGIGLATALKLFPGIFIVYLLVTRRWRAALVASGTAAGATLLAAAVTPTDSWRFWTHELWLTNRVGRPDYTGNQSLFGMLSRFTVPNEAPRWLWLVLVVIVAAGGLWRAARAVRAGDELAGLTLTGLVGALVSPITWTHHVYWFIPAVVVLVDAGLREPREPVDRGWVRRRRCGLLALAVVVYAGSVYGVVSYHDWGTGLDRADDPVTFLLRNLYVLIALALLAALPARRRTAGRPGGSGLESSGGPGHPPDGTSATHGTEGRPTGRKAISEPFTPDATLRRGRP